MLKRCFHALLAIFLICGTFMTLEADIFDYYEEDVDDDFTELDYIRIGGGSVSVGQYGSFLPIVGLGRRYECYDYGIDYSINGGYVNGVLDNPRSVIYYSAPRILCLHYLSECDPFSFYYGGGASWTGIVNNNSKQVFHGVAADGTFGFEMQRDTCIRSFLQLDITQPILSAYSKGRFPTPTIQLSFGLGF